METVLEATEKIAALQPDFMSVTYGAGGGTSRHTTRIAADLQQKYGKPQLQPARCLGRQPIAHLSRYAPEGGKPRTQCPF